MTLIFRLIIQQDIWILHSKVFSSEYSLHSLGNENTVLYFLSYLNLPYPTLSTFLTWSHILTIPYFPPGVYVMAFHVPIHHVP